MKEKWFLQTKRADFNHIYEKFHISPVIARIIRNRDVIGDEDIYNYLNGDLEKIVLHGFLKIWIRLLIY